MSMITQCPQCLAAFHVTPLQLREAQGWVRCGLCQEVFSAQAHALPDMPGEPVEPREEPLPRLGDESLTPNTTPKAREMVPRTSYPKQRRTVWVWIASAALVLLFLLQLAIDQQHRLITQFPLAAAWLQTVCGETHACNLRDIRHVSIRDSDFEAVDKNHFKLRAAVINISGLRLQAPSLAVDLTDSSDGVVERKSFGPKEWGAPADTLSSQAVWPVTLWIEIDPPTNEHSVAGYRLKAFYP